MRVLVCIAHYGVKNRRYLDRMLDEFRSMEHATDIVVLSEAPKDLGDDVSVRVGLPGPSPWSLPFGHREVFAERRDDYDLFIYSEDDTFITARHLRTFCELSRAVPEGYLPGFMRFEIDERGRRSYCTVHSSYRWDPAFAFRHDDLTFATFTNEHAACYMLTRAQLHRAIASGGFLVDPHEGRYEMLETAATDPYTQCGFRKVLCMERIDDLLVHHLPNVYLGKFGIPEAEFRTQIRAVSELVNSKLPRTEYLHPETRMQSTLWNKHCFPKRPAQLADRLGQPGTLLSLGAGAGDPEAHLVRLGWDVTAVPVDAVLGAVAASKGVRTVEPSRLAHSTQLDGATFDVVLAVDVIGYVEDPVTELSAAADLLAPGGRIVATAPDHPRYALRNRLLPGVDIPVPRSFAEDGIHRTSRRLLKRWMVDAGLEVTRTEHRRATRADPVGRDGVGARMWGNTWLVEAKRPT